LVKADDTRSPATIAERPSAEVIAEASADSAVDTPDRAMALLEARRAWNFSLGLGVLCLVGIAAVLVLGGDPIAQRVHIAGLVITATAAFLYVLLRRDPARYRSGVFLLVVISSTTANVTGYFYWGALSGYLGVMAVTGYMFASGSPRREVIALAVLVTSSYLVLGLGQIVGWIDVRSLVIAAPSTSTLAQIVFLFMVGVVISGAIVGGIDTRNQMRRILDEHHAAQRALALRDAQLAEAREEVREARKPGEGRHSGQRMGRFLLAEVLGRGAMGEVYAASDDTGGRYAVKVLASNLLDNEDALRRFQREARAIAGLDAPNVVRMIEVSPPAAALPYLVMERLDGEDLAHQLKQRPVTEVGDVVAIVRAVSAGLDAAHHAGVVHRDLKPANLFAARGAAGVTWKILDFGVSKLFDSDVTLTTGNLVGTPGYMAPEQARGEAVDKRADIYSLGVICYRLLTGRPVVIPGDAPAMVHEVVYRMPIQPSKIRELPPAIEQVLAVALAKQPDDRFATAGELAAALAEAAANVGSPVIAERAAKVLARAPWGAWLSRRRADTRAPTSGRA
jgi:serine/threonine-protein kinase